MKTRKGRNVRRKIKILSIDTAKKEEKKTSLFFNGYKPNFFFKNDTELLHTLVKKEDKELSLRKVSGYTIDELSELFLCGAVEINKNRIPPNFQMERGIKL